MSDLTEADPDAQPDETVALGEGESLAGTALQVLRRGVAVTPIIAQGLFVTFLIGVAYAVGQIALPVTIQS